MRHAVYASIIGLCLAAAPFAAGAQNCKMGPHGAGPGYGMGGGIGMMGMRGGRMLLDPAELPALKTKLAITSEQEAAWTGYADAVKALWDFHGAAGGPPADRQARRERHDAAWDLHSKVWDARDKLRTSLAADQRQQLDQSIPAGCGRR